MSSGPERAARFTIRAGRPADAAQLLAVHRASILALGPSAYSAAECESWAAGLVPEGYRKAMEDGETFFVADRSDGTLAGFCSYKADEIVGLYVHPEAARQGLGSGLMAQAERAIAAAGHPAIRIRAALSALPFYRSHGYQALGQRPWRTRGGLEITVADLIRPLPEPE
ncbi:MAG: GNAT family N-acetyltransferase [Pseudomonadota bacterium]